MYVVFALTAVGLGATDALAYHRQISTIESAYEHRQRLLDANNWLHSASTAVLDASLLAGTQGVKLLITPTAVHYAVGPLPTDRVADEPQGSGWWLPEARGDKWRLWVAPTCTVDVVLSNQGRKNVATSTITRHLTLIREDKEVQCGGLVVKQGRYWTSVPVQLEPGQSVKATAQFSPELPLEGYTLESRLALMLPYTVFRYRPRGKASDWVRGSDTFYATTEDPVFVTDIQYAASWFLEDSHRTWEKVATYSDTGGTGWPGDETAFKSRQSPPFTLTGGRFKLRWTIKPYGGYTSAGPYIFIDIAATNPISYSTEPEYDRPEYAMVETDFYHTASDVFEGGQAAGQYTFQVSGANCRWKLVLWQERWR